MVTDFVGAKAGHGAPLAEILAGNASCPAAVIISMPGSGSRQRFGPLKPERQTIFDGREDGWTDR
jgi:hypothetical protein